MTMGRIWSTNKQGKRFLTNEAKEFKQIIGISFKNYSPGMKGYKKEKIFIANFYGEWHKKNGEISLTAGDLDNFNKLILDGCCEFMDFDDSQIFQILTRKIPSKDSYFFEFDILPMD